MTRTQHGFNIAQKRLELRGPGELFGTRQSGTIAEGASLMGSDAEMLKTTHDLAAELLNHPDDPDAQTVVALAKERFEGRLSQMALN